jgi:nucleoside-diphosphate-sugar epimerase
MRVLVTGATGFIGSWVVQALAQRNHSVIATSRIEHSRDVDSEVEWRVADLLNQRDIEDLVKRERPEGLVHCAWDTAPGKYWNSSKNLNWAAASLQLLESFAANGGQRVVIAGTSAEYCWRGMEPLNETTSLLMPDSLYGVCKNSLRQIVERWASETKLSWAWGRIFCPFGPGEKPERLIPRLLAQLSTGDTIPFDSGQLIRDFLSVEDLGDALAAVLDSNVEGCVNIGSGVELSIRDMVTQLAVQSQSDRVKFGAIPDPIGQPERIVADVQRLRYEVGWVPHKPLRVRLAETAECWRSTQSNRPNNIDS